MNFFEVLDSTLLRAYRSVCPTALQESIDRTLSRLSDERLIIWDLKTVLFVAGILLTYIFMASMEYSGSSTEKWNDYIIDSSQIAQTQPVLGKAKWIRFDEWCLTTPCYRSQYLNDFPIRGSNFGYGESPILMGMPTADITSKIRPQLWSFYFFSFERAFSIYWYFKTFGILLGFFFVLKIISRNNFWLSLGGSIWILYSSYTQWWFSTSGSELMVFAALMTVCGLYVLLSQSRATIIINSILLTLFSTSFVLTLYPPYQVPLGYMVLFVMAAHLWSTYSKDIILNKVFFRVGGILVMFVLMALIMVHFFNTCRESINVMAQTLYPGQRISTGGVIDSNRYFSGVFDYLFSEKRIPSPLWGNPCEASNYLLLWPLVVLGMIVDKFRGGRVNYTQLVLLVYICFLSAWMVFGYPDFLAQITVLNRVRENRALIGIGPVNIILIIHYLASKFSVTTEHSVVDADQDTNRKKKKAKQSQKEAGRSSSSSSILWIAGAISAVVVFGGVYLLGTNFNEATKNFLTPTQIKLSGFLASILAFTLVARLSSAFIGLVVFCVLWSNFMINPIAKGMPALTNKSLMHILESIHKSDPNAKWLSYGSNILANYVIASGADVISGTKFIPDLGMYKILDPTGNGSQAYNRFAHVHVLPNYSAKDSEDMVWRKDGDDAFTWLVNPSSKALEKIGVKYWLSNRLFRAADYAAVEPIVDSAVNNLYLYRRKTTDSLDANVRLAKMVEVKSDDRLKIAEFKGRGSDELGLFIIEGWTYDVQHHNLPSAIYVRVNNHLVKGTVGLASPSANAPEKNCGFRVDIPFIRIGSGTVGMEIIAVSSDGTSYKASPQISVNMN